MYCYKKTIKWYQVIEYKTFFNTSIDGIIFSLYNRCCDSQIGLNIFTGYLTRLKGINLYQVITTVTTKEAVNISDDHACKSLGNLPDDLTRLNGYLDR